MSTSASSRNVLVVAPHPDDEAIACGGAVLRHVEVGDRVTVSFLTSGELGLAQLAPDEARRVREREAERAAAVLGFAELHFLRRPDWQLGNDVAGAARTLQRILIRETPDVVYVPHESEWHPDHRAALPILRAALDAARPRVLAYELWTPLSGWHEIVDVTAVIERKLAAIRCYESQLAALRYDDAALGLNRYRGALAAQSLYAEVFQDAALQPES